jgi:membrane protease YdiL (CAAX protease family)
MPRGGRPFPGFAADDPLSLWGKHSNGGIEPAADDRQGQPGRFPYATWGPGAAIGGVLLAIGVGIILGLPALVFGQQSGGVELFAPPSYSSGTTIRSGEDSVAVAVDRTGGTVYSDEGTSVAALTSGGRLLPGTPFGEFEDSEGIAFDSASGRLYISERSGARIDIYRISKGYPRFEKSIEARALPPTQRGRFEPQEIAVESPHSGRREVRGALQGGAPRSAAGELYVIDRGNETVDRFSLSGAYLGHIGNPDFDFSASEAESGIAVDSSAAASAPHLYVVSRGEGESGHIWAFGESGALLSKLSPPGGHRVCGVATDPRGRVWIADARGGAGQYVAGGRGTDLLTPTGKRAPTSSRACAIAFDASGRLYAGRAPEPLTTAANVVVQLATALGFLLVPIGVAALSAGGSIGDALGKLGVRRFHPSAFKWMAAAVAAYLVFSIAYASLIVEPKQKDIAEGFGALPLQILLISFAAPVSEEVCFRGMLFGGMRTRLPRIGAALLSGLIFGGLHALTGISAVPPLIAFGFVLALLYEKTGSVVPGILLHVLNNSVALLGQ